jgi:hypothetical protein
MNKEGTLLLVLIASVFIVSACASASFNYKNNSLETIYSGGEIVRGTINISLTSEPASSAFTSNFDGSTTLIDLLKNNSFSENIDYTCTFPNCITGYKVKSSVSSLGLDEDTPQVIGFKITGNGDVKVTSIKFLLTSDVGASCSRQILIDVLDKNESFIQSNKNSGVACAEQNKGCFDDGLGSYLSVDLTLLPYCEKMTLNPAPAYQIGAVVINGTKTTNLTMQLYDSKGNDTGDFLADCKLPKNTQGTESVGCVVNYTVSREKNYFVCIYAKDDDSGYQVRAEKESPVCGTDTNGPPFNIDYELFATPLAFDTIGTLEINESLFFAQNENNEYNDGSLIGYVNQYLTDRYQNNCSNGCIIPFKIEGVHQTLNLDASSDGYGIRYMLGSGSTRYPELTIYRLESEESKITTPKYLNVEVEKAGIKIPLTSNATKLYLYLGGQPILPNPLSISVSPSFDFDITPKIVLIGPETEFQAILPATIIHSSWNFGDGTTAESTSKFATHRYVEAKAEGYKVEVELTRSDGRIARRTFDLSMGGLNESATKLVNEYNYRINNITAEIAAFPGSLGQQVERVLDLKNTNLSFGKVKYDLKNATTDEDYSAVIEDTLKLDIPYSIVSKEEGNSMPASIGFGNINTNPIEQISDKTIDSSEKREQLKQSIISWMESNYGANIDYKIIFKYAEKSDKTGEVLLTYVKITATKKGTSDYPAYLIIDYPKDSMKFAQNYSEKSVGSATYIPVGDSTTIEFVVDDAIKIAELGIYVSPEVNNLPGFESYGIVQKAGFNWGRFSLWLGILLIIAFAAYIALQEWYKRNYESSLFKNPNDLYNVINFIHNSRKSGMSDSEIEKKLKSSGWKGEQISYAFKKIDGKRTGMWEIPIFRFFEQKKIKQEIAKRQASQPKTQPSQKMPPKIK